MPSTTRAALPFLDPPPARQLDEARRLLAELSALEVALAGSSAGSRLTDLGRQMLAMPLLRCLARMAAARRPHRTRCARLPARRLLDERDVLRGRPDEVPADVAVRLRLLTDDHLRHPLADGLVLATVRRRAGELGAAGRASRRSGSSGST